MRSIAGENPNRDGKNRTLRAIERPRAESNRRGRVRFERVASLYTRRAALPFRVKMQRFALSVAVWLFLLSRAGNKYEKHFVTRRGVEPRDEGKTFKNLANLSCRVRVRYHNVAREINSYLMNEKSRRAVESNHRNGQLKETAYTTSARHSARRLTTDAGNAIINHQ